MVRSTIVAAVAVALLTQCAAFGSADLVVPVTSYFDLLYTLQSGLHTNYVAEYLKCKLDGGASVNATGGSEVTAYSIDGDGVITFSATKLIFNYQSASGGYVYDHVTTVVLPNGTVSLTATDLIAPDPNSGDPFYTEVFTCQMLSWESCGLELDIPLHCTFRRGVYLPGTVLAFCGGPRWLVSKALRSP